MATRAPIDEPLTPQRERQLIAAALDGCPRSAQSLVELHQDRLHAFVWRMVRNNHDTEEICQEAFLKAFQALDSFDDQYRFSTWLFTIAYRVCLNALRRRRDFAGDVDFSNVAGADSGSEGNLDAAGQVANSDEARRLKKTIWDSVDRLTTQQRATVLLFYRESMSCQEIGQVLDMPASTVKSHLHRARSRLRELLSDELVEDWSVVRFNEEGGAA